MGGDVISIQDQEVIDAINAYKKASIEVRVEAKSMKFDIGSNQLQSLTDFSSAIEAFSQALYSYIKLCEENQDAIIHHVDEMFVADLKAAGNF